MSAPNSPAQVETVNVPATDNETSGAPTAPVATENTTHETENAVDASSQGEPNPSSEPEPNPSSQAELNASSESDPAVSTSSDPEAAINTEVVSPTLSETKLLIRGMPLTSAHLEECPVSNAVRGVVTQLPFTKYTYNLVHPIVETAVSYQPVKFIASSADWVGDSVINKVDRIYYFVNPKPEAQS